LLYQRVFQSDGPAEAMLIAVNFSPRALTVKIPTTIPTHGRTGTLILSTDPQRRQETWSADRFQLGPDEGIVVRLD
jgi:hypothetical protein